MCRVVTAGALGEEASFTGELTLPARLDVLDVDVEAVRFLAVGGEGDALAIVAPAAEGMDGVGMVCQVLTDPPIADGVVGAASDAFKQEKLRPLVTAGVHAVDDLVADWAVVGCADCFVGE